MSSPPFVSNGNDIAGPEKIEKVQKVSCTTSTLLEKYKLGREQAALQVPLQSGAERAPAEVRSLSS